MIGIIIDADLGSVSVPNPIKRDPRIADKVQMISTSSMKELMIANIAAIEIGRLMNLSDFELQKESISKIGG